MPSCLIGLGSNLGNRSQALSQAIERLAQHPDVQVTARSSERETAPVGGPSGQGPFLNRVIVVETSLRPEALLELLRQIETQLGRRRQQRWGPRTVDLDLLLYGQLVLDTPPLVLPHPRMAWRRFVLAPAAEVAGSMVHPSIGWTMARLLEHLDTAADYLAITGSIGVGKSRLAERLARETSGRLIAERLDLGRLDVFYADPPSHAWQTELEFAEQRARRLDAGLPEWSERRLAVSDFWFDQSAAFAEVWLPLPQRQAYCQHWQQLRSGVVRPKLIVLLEAPPEELLRRVRRRGRRCEFGLREEQLGRIQQAIVDRATRRDQGPLLRLAQGDPEQTLGEVLAAVDAMQ
ncbi:MAG: 2-amino-4-hydroxy-6-hydroxymethyldihydropteridine diphosphokinase [Pirellulales bacterium]|nr:2-amino-4-hydroxy-6-hydroxymethyldihydropteridine diphosphokinase [Pirellulales bacterium]